MKFFKEIKQYSYYMYYAARANLRAQVAGSYLNWAWWVLEPLGMMIVYTIIFGLLFKQSVEFFPIFVFIGNTLFGFISSVVISSVSLMKNNQALLSRIYIPKHVVLIVEMLINGFKMFIQFILIVILMALFHVPISINVFWTIPIIAITLIFTFGLSAILLNWGVFLEDLGHAMTIVMSVWMYFSGIFYEFRNLLPEQTANLILVFNPAACVITALRDALLYSRTPNRLALAIWFILGVILSFIGIRVIYKNENGYVKRI